MLRLRILDYEVHHWDYSLDEAAIAVKRVEYAAEFQKEVLRDDETVRNLLFWCNDFAMFVDENHFRDRKGVTHSKDELSIAAKTALLIYYHPETEYILLNISSDYEDWDSDNTMSHAVNPVLYFIKDGKVIIEEDTYHIGPLNTDPETWKDVPEQDISVELYGYEFKRIWDGLREYWDYSIFEIPVPADEAAGRDRDSAGYPMSREVVAPLEGYYWGNDPHCPDQHLPVERWLQEHGLTAGKIEDGDAI